MEDFRERMLAIAAIGQEADGAVSRVFGSAAYAEAAEAMKEYMCRSGLESYKDSVGNVHGIFRCGRKDAREILIVSHLDTVLHGGVFDGLLGIMAGIECVRMIRETGERTDCDIHVIATNGEEGNELGGTFGSRAMMGMLPETEDFYELAQKYGYTKEALSRAIYDTGRCKAYLELHIEQGNTLEKEQKKIGIVTGIVGLERYQVTMMGKSNHAGTTMMEYREDAVTAAARFIAAMDEKTREIGDHLVCTFSRFTITPNVLAVINREVTMVLECRNQKKERMEELASEAKRFLSGQKAKMEPLVKKDPVDCHPAIVEQMEQVCIKQNISYRKMPSGATHDGNCFAKKMPIGMLFIPSIGGVSHCREEESAWEDVMRGISVLHDTVLRLAAEEEDGRCWI